MDNKNNNQVKYIVVHESTISSIFKDIFTFLMFAGLLMFNHQLLGGSTVVDVMFIILVLLCLAGKKSKNYFSGTKEEVIKYLQDQKA